MNNGFASETIDLEELFGSEDIKMLLDKIQAKYKYIEAKKAAQEARKKSTEVSTSSVMSGTQAKKAEQLPRQSTPRPSV